MVDKLIVTPLRKTTAEIIIPGDKSISHRAVMLGALAEGETVIENFLMSGDCLATIECFREMGVGIESSKRKAVSSKQKAESRIVIKGQGQYSLKPTQAILNVGNSGTTIRLLTGILAGQPFVSRISGDASIQRRPMLRVVKPLREMGADIEGKIEGNNIYAPLFIHGGNLAPIEYTLPVASAQVKSAVLLAGLFAKGQTMVIEKNQSRDHTERMLASFGAAIKVENLTSILTGRGKLAGQQINVPGDISSAAFFMVAGLILPAAEIVIHNVGLNPTRTGIIDILHRMGANLEIIDERIISNEPRGEIRVRSSKLQGIKIEGEIIPRIIDEIPIIALAATQAEGITEIRGAQELRFKESDRIATVASELIKMGAEIKTLEDGLIIQGPTKLKGANINSYGDHRIAMTGAIAGLITAGTTSIENTACIETSFPGFDKILTAL